LTRARTTGLVLLGLCAVALVVVLARGDLERPPAPRQESHVPGAASEADVARAPSVPAGRYVPEEAAPAPDGAQASGARGPDERFQAHLAAWRRQRETWLAARQGASGEAKDAAEDALAAQRTALIEALRAAPALAEVLWSEVEAARGEEALALGRILRFSRAPGLGARLARRARHAQGAAQREAALVALEGRAADLWLEPVTAAFVEDADAGVRKRASEVLGHALADRMYLPEREALRAPLLEAAQARDPQRRRLAIAALGLDAHPEDGDLERMRALAASDPDPDVRRAALAASRMLLTRIEMR